MNGQMKEQIIVELMLMNEQFDKSMRKVGNALNRLNRNLETNNKQSKKGNNQYKQLNSNLKKMRMNLFGLVYGMQLLNGIFKSMTKPAMDALNMSELWSTTMTVLMLPAITSVYDEFLKLNSAIMDLPEPAKKFIGWGALIGDGLTELAMDVGVLALAFSSLTGKNVLDVLSSVSKAIKDFGVGRTISIVVGVAITMDALIDSFNMLNDVKTDMGTRLINIFQLGLGGALIGAGIGGIPGALIGLTIGIGVGLVISLLDIAWENGVDEWLIAKFTAMKDWLVKEWNSFWGTTSYSASGLDRGSSDAKVAKTGSSGAVISARKTGNTKQDMIWRAGSPPISINPNDTLLAFKNQNTGASQIGGGPVINMYNTIGVADRSSIERIMQDVADKITREIRRNTA